MLGEKDKESKRQKSFKNQSVQRKVNNVPSEKPTYRISSSSDSKSSVLLSELLENPFVPDTIF